MTGREKMPCCDRKELIRRSVDIPGNPWVLKRFAPPTVITTPNGVDLNPVVLEILHIFLLCAR